MGRLLLVAGAAVAVARAATVSWAGGDGAWADESGWSSGSVPAEADDVVVASGTVSVAADAALSVASLAVSAGATLHFDATTCPDGWVPLGRKCFRGYAGPAAWADAEAACHALDAGSGHVAVLESVEEAMAADRACRAAGTNDCWIGLTAEDQGEGEWDWPSGDDGEHCAWQYSSWGNPESQRAPRWRNDDCATPRAYVCSQTGDTRRATLAVAGDADLAGGVLTGPGDVAVAGHADLSGAELAVAAHVAAAGTAEVTTAALTMGSGAALSVAAAAQLSLSADIATGAGATPQLTVESGGTLTAETDLSVGAQLAVQGTLSVADNTHVTLEQGGYAVGSVVIPATAAVAVNNASFALTAPEAQSIVFDAERTVVDQEGHRGYVRFAYQGERSACVPFHVGAERLQGILNDLDTVAAAGGVAVRRQQAASEFGHVFEVLFDRASDYGDADEFEVWGVGPEANCSALHSPLHGHYHCLAGETSVGLDSCTITPSFAFATLATSGAAALSGEGQLTFANGSHVGPHSFAGSLAVEGGSVALRGDAMAFGAVTVAGGDLHVTAAGVEAWAARDLVYAGEQTVGRDDAALQAPPSLALAADALAVRGGNVRVTAGSDSALDVGALSWTGGHLWGGGGCVLTALETLDVGGAGDKMLRDGLHLVNADVGVWGGDGSVLAGEGAGLTNRGSLTVTANGDWQLVSTPTPTLSRQNGWYDNPQCRADCATQPWIVNAAGADLTKLGDAGSRTEIGARLWSAGASLVVGSDGADDDGALAGVDVTLDVLGGGHVTGEFTVHGGALAIVGGRSLDLSAVEVTGSGTLEFRDGPHRGAPVVDADVVLRHGAVVRYNHSSVVFGNTLWQEAGAIEFESRVDWEIQGHARVDAGRWEVPQRHSSSAVWHPERSTVRLGESFTWNGGALVGNADMHAPQIVVFGGGQKELRHKWFLKTYARLDWVSGDLVTYQLSELRIEGEVQMFGDYRVIKHGQWEEEGQYEELGRMQWE